MQSKRDLDVIGSGRLPEAPTPSFSAKAGESDYVFVRPDDEILTAIDLAW